MTSKDPDSKDRSEIDDYPALFRSDLQDLIVVGATNNDGKTWPNTQAGELLDLSAPGENIVCAKRDGDNKIVKSGTSFCKSLARTNTYLVTV